MSDATLLTHIEILLEEKLDEKLKPLTDKFKELDMRTKVAEMRLTTIDNRIGSIEEQMRFLDNKLDIVIKGVEKITAITKRNQEILEEHTTTLEGINDLPSYFVERKYFNQFAQLNNLKLLPILP